MSSGKLALPSTPKLESQLSFEGVPSKGDLKSLVTRGFVKGAVFGTIALLVVSTLGSGTILDHVSLAPSSWGWGPHHEHGHSWPVDCSVWEDFDFDAPLKSRGGRHPHMPQYPGPPIPPDVPVPPPPRPPVPPRGPAPPDLPAPPTPPSPPSPPGVPPPRHELSFFNISSSVSEIRLASMGFLGHGVVRVEPAAEDVDIIQVQVRGAHGRVCALKDDDGQIIGVGLLGYMRHHGHKRKSQGWWQPWSQPGFKAKRELDSLEVGDGEGDSFDLHPVPPHGGFPPPPGDLPPPPPGRKMPPPPPPPSPPYPPPHPPHHIHAPILINVRVPASRLPALRTRLPFFTHDLSSPAASSFANLDLATRDASVALGSIIVRDGGNATIRSTNAPIRGGLEVHGGWAIVETKNAAVDVEVVMRSGDEKQAGVELKSSNAPIIATLDLDGSGKDRFTVVCVTSNAHLALNVTSQPRGALLFLNGHTSNAPASVQLHPNYEGTFDLTSSVVAPGVVESTIEGRKVETKRVGGRVTGSVWYTKEEEKLIREGGEVVVTTSNAPNTLLL